MTTRNFKQLGQGYGAIPCVVTATLDGVVIYNGVVSTLDEPFQYGPFQGQPPGVELFTWTRPVDFQGTQQYSISVSGSPLLLSDTIADHVNRSVSAEFGIFYQWEETGNIIVSDPLSDSKIDGIPLVRDHVMYSGQWCYPIFPGSTFTAALNVNPGVEPNYIVFDSIPSSVSPGFAGEFQVSIPQVSPTQPLPATYIWQIVNGTTTDADFTTTTGNVVFANANSAFSVSTVSGATAGIFKVKLVDQVGNSISPNVSVS